MSSWEETAGRKTCRHGKSRGCFKNMIDRVNRYVFVGRNDRSNELPAREILETDKSVSISYSTCFPRLKSWAVKHHFYKPLGRFQKIGQLE